MYFIVLLASVLSIASAKLVVSGSGSTTQNWNCCKPSCAWDGKANVSAPVRTCDINNQPLANSSAVSSCQNGTAYMCADQAPWLVGEDLAYGYAAVTIEGGSEASWCCACYELLFTSGPADGKRMIVQATDTEYGAPTGTNFVLAIPGAHLVGDSSYGNSCIAQYGPQGWDQEMGGLISNSSCSLLPSGFQAACMWRFSWFGNDYPSVDFTQVSCPTELTNKTNCIRGDDSTLLTGPATGLNRRDKIAISVMVPAGFILGALAAIWASVRLRSRRKARKVVEKENMIPDGKSTDRQAAERTDIGIKKTTETHYFELESGPAKKHDLHRPHKAEKPKVPDKTLTGLRKVKEKPKQELEGCPASELSGDTLGSRTRDSMMKSELSGDTLGSRTRDSMMKKPLGDL